MDSLIKRGDDGKDSGCSHNGRSIISGEFRDKVLGFSLLVSGGLHEFKYLGYRGFAEFFGDFYMKETA